MVRADLFYCHQNVLTFHSEFLNNPDTYNITSVDIFNEPVNGFNFNATISVQNPTPFTVTMVTIYSAQISSDVQNWLTYVRVMSHLTSAWPASHLDTWTSLT